MDKGIEAFIANERKRMMKELANWPKGKKGYIYFKRFRFTREARYPLYDNDYIDSVVLEIKRKGLNDYRSSRYFDLDGKKWLKIPDDAEGFFWPGGELLFNKGKIKCTKK